MKKILARFRLKTEIEDFPEVIKNIESGVVFRGTNLWVLIFAIFVASLGLNVNSTAVIIGAMLISPLMGPIIGMGLGLGIHDLALLKKAALNYLFAVVVSLLTSTVFFLLSPIDEAHSEILSRTSPNIYDVLIAFFGGMAGIIALSSRLKGNVIPGVAIATALMPPLCTAGYGLATWRLNFFFGAFYLFIINTVFIALATLITLKFLNFPYKEEPYQKERRRVNRIVFILTILTILPSLYFGYDIVQQNKFEKNVNKFISKESFLKDDYLLRKETDKKKKLITLVYGGRKITPLEIDSMRMKLAKYGLAGATLEIKQGFAIIDDIKSNKEFTQVANALQGMETDLKLLRQKLDSLTLKDSIARTDTIIQATLPKLKTVRKKKR